MNTQDFINNAEYLIRQCLNQKNIDPIMEAWLRRWKIINVLFMDAVITQAKEGL